jgi:hypothetical protein
MTDFRAALRALASASVDLILIAELEAVEEI